METTPGRAPRQLLIGVDAMEWTLVVRLVAEGKLPTFRHLIEHGLSAELASFGDCLPDAVWTTLAYGVNPGKLEKYFYVRYDPAASGLRYADDEELRGTPFWQYLARAGRRVGVVDLPHLPFDEIPDGFRVSGWGAHDVRGGLVASPRELESEILARLGAHPVPDCEEYNSTPRSRRRLRDDFNRGIRLHGELFRWLMTSRPWDVFLCAFSASHCAGHHFWGAMGPGGAADAGFADAVEQSYRAIDREIGEMLAVAGPGTRVFVVAPHGMGPLVHASWNLNEILDLLGYGRTRGATEPRSRPRRGRVNPWRIVKMIVPSRWQYAIKKRLPQRLQDELLFLWYAGGRRCRGRRAFAVPNNEIAAAIRLAVKGRDPDGLVEPGDDYRRHCHEITAALEELVDPASGRRVVRKVTAMHEVFHGPFVDRLPDLAVLWDARFAWSAVHSPRFGTLRLARQDKRSGSHSPSSFVLAMGPGVTAGTHLEGRSTLDIAPTILASAGVPVPGHMDGTPLPLPIGS